MHYSLVRSKFLNASLAILLLVSTLFSINYAFATPVDAADEGSLKDYLQDKIENESDHTVSEIATALSEIVYSTTTSEMEDAVKGFKDTYHEDFKIIFGEDVTVGDFLDALEIYEEYLRENYDPEENLSTFLSAFNGSITDFVSTTLNEAIDEYEQLENLEQNIKEHTGLTLQDVFEMKPRLDEQVGLDSTLRTEIKEQFYLAAFEKKDELSGAADYEEMIDIIYSHMEQENEVLVGELKQVRKDIRDQNIDWGYVLGTVETPGQDEGDQDTGNNNTGGGGGGGATTPSDDDEDKTEAPSVEIGQEDVEESTTPDGKKQTKVTVDTEKINDIVNSDEDVEEVNITVPEDDDSESASVSVPADAFNAIKEKNENAKVTVKSNAGSYSLGVKEINVEEIAASLGSESSEEVEISIEITQSEDTTNAVANNGAESASPVVEFKVTATAGDNSSEVNNFSGYVSRSIPLTASDDSEEEATTDNLTAVRINDEGTLTAVPTVFVDGEAVFRSLTNSKYTVVKNDKSFTDVHESYWASDVITRLANKLIIAGQTEEIYAPKQDITRAEMTSLIARSLGLTASGEYDDRFSDVYGSEWFAGSVMAAAEAGIVVGDPSGTFRPNDTVNRDEAAVMIAAALEFTGYNADNLDGSESLDQFADSDKVADWSKDAVQLTVEANIFNGKDDAELTFDPKGKTIRAEAAQLLNEYLEFVEFIN